MAALKAGLILYAMFMSIWIAASIAGYIADNPKRAKRKAAGIAYRAISGMKKIFTHIIQPHGEVVNRRMIFK